MSRLLRLLKIALLLYVFIEYIFSLLNVLFTGTVSPVPEAIVFALAGSQSAFESHFVHPPQSDSLGIPDPSVTASTFPTSIVKTPSFHLQRFMTPHPAPRISIFIFLVLINVRISKILINLIYC